MTLPGANLIARSAGPLRHPARTIASAFGLAVVVGTTLLSLPVATENGRAADPVDALFTATSAVCLTGLVTVDTSTHWSVFGELVIMALMQIGGLGIMTLATVIALLLGRRLGLRARVLAQAETRALRLTDVRHLVRNIVIFSAICEAAAAVVLTVRLALAYDYGWGAAAYHGLFHAVSAFNNGGFSTFPDNMTRFVDDAWICVTISVAVLIGGLGFPVVFELARSWRRPGQWSVLTRLTIGVTTALMVFGTVAFALIELGNPRTFGPLSPGGHVLASFFAAANTRSGGFNSVDIAALTPESLLVSDVLMFIGGGSGGTAGGIKVTTFGLLAYVVWTEMRGERRVNVGRRHVPESNQRQALAITLLGIGLVTVATFILLGLGEHALDRVLFDAISAFATVGLSTGVTAELPRAGHVVLVVLMFLGRLGPLTLFSALAFTERERRYEYPEERTIVG
jgi:potassium uptake TrkH family protein